MVLSNSINATQYTAIIDVNAVGLATMVLLTPDSKYWPISWVFNAHPLEWLPALDPPNAPPPPPTIWQKLLKLVGVSGTASPVKTTNKPKAKDKSR